VVQICEIRFPAAAGVVASHSFTINPPLTKFRVICHRKDRDGCGCSRGWTWCFKFCLFGGRTPVVIVCFVIFSMLYFVWVVVVVLRGRGGGFV